MIDATKTAKQAEIAALLGLSITTVRAIESRGIASRAMSLQDWLRAYCDNLREQAAGRASDGALSLPDERAKLAQAQRERIELELSVKRGRLLDADEVEGTIRDMILRARGRLLALPHRLASVCAHQPRGIVEREAQAVVYEALHELATPETNQ